MRAAMGLLSSRGRGGFFGGLGAVDDTSWHAQRSVTRAPKCLVSEDKQHTLTDLSIPSAFEDMVGRMVDVPRPDRRDTQASPQRKVGSPEPARKTMSTTSGVERVTLQVHSGRLPTTEGGPRTEEVNSQVHMGLTSTKIPADLLRAEMRRMALYSHVTLSSTPSTEWETRFGDAATITVSMATLAPADMRRAARANVEWGKCPTDRPKQVAAPCDSTRSASENRECGGILFRSGTGQIFLLPSGDNNEASAKVA